MGNVKITRMLMLGLTTLTLIGCTTSPNKSARPTGAGLMRRHGDEQQVSVDRKNQLAGDWDQGAKLVASGEKKVKDANRRIEAAERDLTQGQADVESGNQEISEGRKMISESERRFREEFPGLDIKTVK